MTRSLIIVAIVVIAIVAGYVIYVQRGISVDTGTAPPAPSPVAGATAMAGGPATDPFARNTSHGA